MPLTFINQDPFVFDDLVFLAVVQNSLQLFFSVVATRQRMRAIFQCNFKDHSAAVITRTDRCDKKITKQVTISTNCLLTSRCGRSSGRR